MRIAGKRVETDGVVEVFNPYTNEVVGTVPAARPEHVREAFRTAKAFKATLTRFERQRILQRTAEILRDRTEEIRAPDHGRIGPVLEGLALRGEPRLRRMVLRRPAHHQGRRRDLRLRHLAERQAAQDLHDAHAAARRDLGDHAVQSPSQHGQPQAGAGGRHQQPRRPEADRADAAYRPRPRRRALRGRTAARDAVGRDRQPLDHGRRHDHRPGRRPHHLHGLGQGRQIHRREGRLPAHRP